MLLAGLGSRFSKAGYKIPKPLIEIDGQPMFMKALSSIENIDANKSFHFVIRQEHVDSQQLDKLIKGKLPKAHIIIIPEMTRGAAETALIGARSLAANNGLIVMDCDLWFQSESYNTMVQESLEDKTAISGGVLTFTAEDARYSYAKFGSNGIVTQTAEKQVISNHAITGAYYFGRVSDFVFAAETLLIQPLGEKMPEYYMSLLYNILIDERKQVKAAVVDKYASFGTPEELAAYTQTAQ